MTPVNFIRMENVLRCPIGTSRRVSIAIVMVHAAALVGLVIADIEWVASGIGAVTLVANGWRNLALVGTRASPRAFIQLDWLGNDHFCAWRRDGSALEGRWVGHALVHPWLVSLRIAPAGSTSIFARSVSVPGDATRATLHRQLRITLKHGAGHC